MSEPTPKKVNEDPGREEVQPPGIQVPAPDDGVNVVDEFHANNIERKKRIFNTLGRTAAMGFTLGVAKQGGEEVGDQLRDHLPEWIHNFLDWMN